VSEFLFSQQYLQTETELSRTCYASVSYDLQNDNSLQKRTEL